MRRLVACHHLASIGKDGGGEQAKGIDTWVGDKYEEVLGGWGFEEEVIEKHTQE